MKKLVSLGLALVMCLALMIPALASEETFETENSAMVPTVEVELPSSGVVILNPYAMKYSGDAMSGLAKNATDQILSNVFSLTNKTQGGNLKVKATVTAAAEGNAVLEAKATAIKSGDKANTVILNLKYSITQNANASAPTTIATGALASTLQMTGSEQSLQDANKKDIVLSPSDGTKHTYMSFQFAGLANSASTLETPWTEDDKVGATFVFTFEPTSDPATTALSASTGS